MEGQQCFKAREKEEGCPQAGLDQEKCYSVIRECRKEHGSLKVFSRGQGHGGQRNTGNQLQGQTMETEEGGQRGEGRREA